MKRVNDILIFMTEKGETFLAYDIDRQANKIGGYLLFPPYGKPNPYRQYDMNTVRFANIHNAKNWSEK